MLTFCLILLPLNSCGSSIVIFDELFITFKTLYGPINLGMSFCTLCFGSTKGFVDRYTKSFLVFYTGFVAFIGILHLLYSMF